jgi:single-strand DNA-binding protein
LSGTVNRVILIGRLGKDPEIKYTPSGMAKTEFSLATDESRKDAQGNRTTQTEWHNIVLWAKQAETAGQYLKKGKLIYVEGRIQTRSWEDNQGGGTRYRTEIIGDRFTMLGGRGDEAGTGSSEMPRTSAAQATPPEAPERPEDDEDLPF